MKLYTCFRSSAAYRVRIALNLKCDLARYPTLVAIDGSCRALDAFQRAAPERQADTE